MSIDTYRRAAQRKLDEYNKLQNKEAKIKKEATNALDKASKVTIAASKTKSPTTRKSKMSEADRYNKKYYDAQKKLSALGGKISQKHNEYMDALNKLAKEEKRENEIKQREEQRRQKEFEQTLNSMTSAIVSHNDRQNAIECEVEKLKRVPSSITILFLATNPKDTNKLRLDEEARNVREMINKAKHRDSVDLQTRWAVRTTDLLQSINETKPTIIHFAGHGAESGDLALEDENGNAKMVSPEAVLKAVESTGKDSVKLVYFDSCNSFIQAEKLTEVIDAAIGMTDDISDQVAIRFASQFYSAISFGVTLQDAFDQAKASLMMEYPDESDVPCLYISDESNADDMIIVNPDQV